MSKNFIFPNTAEPGRTDWIDYVMPPKGSPYPRLYRVNLSWMLSHWKCSFGSCPGILLTGALTDVSCCQIGVQFGQWEGPEAKWEEFNRVKKAVQELTPEDWDHGYGKDKADNYWATFKNEVYSRRQSKVKGKRSKTKPQPVPEQTVVVNGGCIFANRHGGAAGKPGCAFHVLAERTGRHHSETKPDICWMIPFFIGDKYDDEIQMDVYTVNATPATTWGPFDTSSTDTVGHWCTEIPDHFTGTDPVYKYAEIELRKMLGDEEYERMCVEIELAESKRTERPKMPAELVNGGRKTLPLLVLNRQRQWAAEGMDKQAATAERWLMTEMGKD